METLVIHSNSKSNIRLLSELARKLGDVVFASNEKFDKTETHFASETVLAKDWLSTEEEKVWENL
jgi:hypothetical protein